MRNLMIGLLCILCMFVSVQAHAEEGQSVSYTSPEGIQFVSHSPLWNEQKLEGLYRVLLKCEHGEEFAMLKQVILNPDSVKGRSGYKVGNYDESSRTIRLFEVDSLPVERTLIHEYGHHFSYYWLRNKEGLAPHRLTAGAAWSHIRQLDGYPIRWWGSSLPYSHQWDPDEIMAEDYVALFGVEAMEMPEQAKDVVRHIRHENEYIPPAQSIPALRSYWEELAGLTKRQPLKMPLLQNWEASSSPNTESGTETVTFRFTFSPAAVEDTQLIDYGISLTGFGRQAGVPLHWTAGTAAKGKEWVGAKLDVEQPPNTRYDYFHLQVWALDRLGGQLNQTPLYMNWFEYDPSTLLLQSISPPFYRSGWQEILKKEGMERWPLLHIFIDGLPVDAISRPAEEDEPYVPWRLFNPEYDSRMLTADWNRHSVEFQSDYERFTVDDVPARLKKPMRWIDNEPYVSADDLPQMFGVSLHYDNKGSSLFIEPN
ncbi:hypothetical protein [Paenibacillus piri]|uniref:Uncharacterized protein n=1 Tax=Paenibacillus piri TaxID=2547395 RepID=A0A4R5KPL1_9BACL|nr:hypothetical protein [Paenibacillus piri]TDF96590.1 hypothetical protein E1757_15950 [Paenibacillus piri]